MRVRELVRRFIMILIEEIAGTPDRGKAMIEKPSTRYGKSTQVTSFDMLSERGTEIGNRTQKHVPIPPTHSRVD